MRKQLEAKDELSNLEIELDTAPKYQLPEPEKFMTAKDKLPDSCLSLLLPSLGNENKPVYGFCDFLILFLSDTSIHGRCPPANLLH